MVTKVTNWLNESCDLCTKVRPIFMLLFYIVVSCFSVYGMYLLQDWWKDNSPAVSFGQGDITPTIVRPGDKMLVHLTVNKLRNCDGEVFRVVTGECGHHVLAHVEATLDKGFSGRVTLPFQLPHEAIPGDCGFRVHARYNCNPFDWIMQRQVFVSDLIPFKVVGYSDLLE